jgi:nicotinamide-nucleotide amidase
MKAEIITIGDELLIGQVIDTNSAWISVQLNLIGIEVVQIVTVSDKPEHLVDALDNAQKRAEIIIMTGGLGPTKDDRTKKTLSGYFQSELISHKDTLDHIANFFAKRGLELTALNETQALVPKICTVLPNDLGTAPGMWFDREGKIFISLPGVPFEMQKILNEHVLPQLKKVNQGFKIVHHTILTYGIPESFLAQQIEEWELSLPEHIHLAYLPSPGIIRLRLSAYGNNKSHLESEINFFVEKLQQIIPDAIFGFNNNTMAEVIGKLLISEGKTLAVAESCTGGNIAHEITMVPGSSNWFKGGIIAYSNEIKIDLLKVDPELINQFGAVSQQVVFEMAQNVRKLFNADYGIATSGIAGPGGGSPEKPVGTTWMAVSSKDKIETVMVRFANDRERNIKRATLASLNMLRLLLKEVK